MVNLSPKLRFPEFSGNWKSKKLEEVGTVINGLTYSPDDIHDDGVLVLRSSNVKENQLSFSDNVYVNTDNYNAVKENDILICVRNGSRNLIGKNALITKEAEGVAFGAFMSVYRSELNKFVFQLFATDTYYKIIQENLGATINSINNSDLKKFEFYFPLKDEQDKIADFLSKVDIKINQLSKKKFNSTFDFIQNLAIIDNAPWLCTPNGIIKYDELKTD
jgi:type I restriction enzyme S subunit